MVAVSVRLFVGLGALALALLLWGGSSASAGVSACQATAQATGGWGSTPGNALSTPLMIEVSCKLPTEISLRAPGGEREHYHVDAQAPLRIDGERAYLCHGQEATVEVSSVALDWSAAAPISGINGIPQCDLMLREGGTLVQWTGPRTRIREAFAGRALGWLNWERGAGGTVPGLTVWSFREGESLPQWGWGEGIPQSLGGLAFFERGREYLVVSDIERAWTFPRPPSGRAVLDDAQIVSFYGHPGVPAMGPLGYGTPAEVANEIAVWAAHYDALNGPREVIPAYHLITAVAQAYPTADGTWLYRLEEERIAEYVEAARDREMILFVDVQIGWSDPLTEVMLLERFLREPFVHMAIDPEFATRHLGIRPGLAIGSVTAEQVNEVQHYLAGLVAEEGIPPKILVVHQFADRMLLDREAVESVDGVDLSIDMDGFGGIGVKLRHYDWYALTAPSERPGLKLFFDEDSPIMTPEQVQALDHAPDIIQYQ